MISVVRHVKGMMRKMEVSMFKVRNHIMYSYPNITDCGRQKLFPQAPDFLSLQRGVLL
jgi:uncharacterized membrane protein SirB2